MSRQAHVGALTIEDACCIDSDRSRSHPGCDWTNVRQRVSLPALFCFVCAVAKYRKSKMIKLWGRTTSANVQKVMWALAELDIAHERIDAGGAFGRTDTVEYAAMNPNRLVPVIDDDGFCLWESEAIVRYLAASYGVGRLLPADPKEAARADQWMMFSATSLQPEIIGACFWGLIRTSAADRNVAGIEAAAKRAGEKLGILDRQLAGRAFILGDSLTMSDISVGALMYRYFTLPIARPSLPNVEAWYGRLADRRSYREIVMTEYASLKVAGA